MTKDIYDKEYFRKIKKFLKYKGRFLDLLEEVKKYNPSKVLDVGCGFGVFVDMMRREKIEAWGIDFSDSLWEYWKGREYFLRTDADHIPFINNYFDIVVSSDFFEHIPEDQIDRIYSEMKRVGGIVIARIAYEDNLKESQKKYHCTNKPKSWWEEKLKDIILFDYGT
jgi:ubiquinone/menaquinone biosynthesis C-methylase UbiE